MDNVREMLEEEILSRGEMVSSVEPGTEDDTATVDSICKMTDRLIMIETKKKELELKQCQLESELELKREQLEKEEKLKREQIEDSRKQWKIGLIAGAVTGAVGWGAKTAWNTWFVNTDRKFELDDHGMHSTNIGRQGVSKVISKVFR